MTPLPHHTHTECTTRAPKKKKEALVKEKPKKFKAEEEPEEKKGPKKKKEKGKKALIKTQDGNVRSSYLCTKKCLARCVCASIGAATSPVPS